MQPFDIPAQPAADALDAFVRQTRLELVYRADIVRGIRTNAVRGRHTARAALDLMLSGTGLTVVTTPRGAITIRATTPPTEPAASNDDAGAEAIVVTGTRLRGTSPTSPVISYDREDFARNGFTSAQDALAKTPQNFSGVSSATAGRNLNLGFSSQADIRGLGSEATLTLVNGRRVTGAAGDDGRAFDLSMIPIAAIARIDILTDGASALYGSDAIGGVVNIILRSDFSGSETTLRYGRNRFGNDEFLASQVLGTAWEGGHLLVAGQFDRSDPQSFSDIGLGTRDLRARGGGDFRTPLFAAPGTVVPIGFSAGLPFSTITGPGGSPVFSATLPDGDGRSVQVADLGLNQIAVGDQFRRDMLAAQENASVYATIEQDIGGITLFADGIYARRKASQVQSNLIQPLFVPRTNAFSPFEEDVLVYAELGDFGPLNLRNDRDGWIINAGARGAFAGDDWRWSLTGTASHDESQSRLTFVDFIALAGRLASPDPATAFNPFGNGTGQSPGVVDALESEIVYNGVTNFESLAGQASGTLLTLPGGNVQLAVGAEYRRESLWGFNDAGSLGSRDLYGDAARSMGALFGELYVPVVGRANAAPAVRELALSLAARAEHYSDFGDAFNPKIGLLWRPFDDLTLKANWGTSFRAPSLRELHFASATSENVPVFDPRRPGGPGTAIVDILQGGNADLTEETAHSHTVTGEYRPGWLTGGRLSVTYYHLRYRNRIRGTFDGLDVGTLLANEGLLPEGVIVRDPSGALTQIRATNINTAKTVVAGLDLAAGFSWSSAALGDWDLSAGGTYFTRYDDTLINGLPITDMRGTVGNPPKWRGRASINWSRGWLGATVSVNHIDGFVNRLTDPRIVRRSVDSQTTFDAQFRLSPDGRGWPSGFVLRLGVDNLFDARPPFVDGPDQGIDATNALLRSRTVYLAITKEIGG